MTDASAESSHPFAATYRERERQASAAAESIASRSRLVSNLRGLAFGAFAIGLLVAIFGSSGRVPAIISAVGALAFAALLVVHQRILDREDEARRRARVNRDAWLRVSGRFRELPQTGAEVKPPAHPYADDLDVLGPGSLFQRLCTAHTPYGRRALAQWLTTPQAGPVIAERQRAVQELAPLLEERQRLEALALFAVDALGSDGKKRAKIAPDPEPFVNWAKSPPVLSQRPVVVWGSRILPPVTLATLVAWTALGTPAYWFTIPLLLQFALLHRAREATLRAFEAVATSEGALARYGAMLEVLEKLDAKSGFVARLKADVSKGGAPPSEAMRALGRRVGWFELRHNGLVHPFANALLLWDVHCTLSLEAWQVRSGQACQLWLLSLGELEALCSLAALAHDEPEYAFPTVSPETRFEAEALGHPLLPSDSRVTNDVTLARGGVALLVTGSNMSGKSTLLRAIGLAAAMAQAGGPVCAKALVCSRFAIRTSIRVSDSLEAGVSHFYAEVGKLKAVMDATSGELPVLFLLDEILHGTNSRERQIGARWVLAELLGRGATGAISTHDMELCRLPDELMTLVTLVHFRESVRDGKMTFDYRARPGPVTSGNALRLMQLVGLDVPLDEPFSRDRNELARDPEA